MPDFRKILIIKILARYKPLYIFMNIKLKKIYFDCKPVFKINDVKMSIWIIIIICLKYRYYHKVSFGVNHRVHTFLYIFMFNNSTFYL